MPQGYEVTCCAADRPAILGPENFPADAGRIRTRREETLTRMGAMGTGRISRIPLPTEVFDGELCSRTFYYLTCPQCDRSRLPMGTGRISRIPSPTEGCPMAVAHFPLSDLSLMRSSSCAASSPFLDEGGRDEDRSDITGPFATEGCPEAGCPPWRF
jgi:hypothetical protein